MKAAKYIMCRVWLVMSVMLCAMPVASSPITDRAAKAYNQELYTEA